MMTNGKQAYCGDHVAVYTSIKLLLCIPETNIMLYTNFTLKNTGILLQMAFTYCYFIETYHLWYYPKAFSCRVSSWVFFQTFQTNQQFNALQILSHFQLFLTQMNRPVNHNQQVVIRFIWFKIFYCKIFQGLKKNKKHMLLLHL